MKVETKHRTMTPAEQVKEWVAGVSIHNDGRDECCPDFSCCHPELLASQKERARFQQALLDENRGLMDNMLMMFLGALLTGEGMREEQGCTQH